MKKLLILLLPLLLTGCYNYKDINKLAIVSAIAIDKDYNISIQAINAKKDENVKPKFYVYSSNGISVENALNNTINITSLDTYLNHLDILLIDEELARDGISDILDYFYRSTDIRVEFIPIICKGYKCKDIIKLETTLQDLNSKNIKSLIENDKIYLGNVNDITFTEMLNDYLNPYNEITLPSVTLTGTDIDTSKVDIKSYIKTTNMAYFKDDKLIGYLDGSQSIAYNFINNNINNLVLTVPCGEYFTINLVSSKTKIKYQNNTVYIDIKLNGNLSEINSDIDISNNIEMVNKKTEEKIKNDIINTINYFVEKDIDIFKFKDLVYKTSKKNIKLNNIKYNVKVDANITSSEYGMKVINEKYK